MKAKKIKSLSGCQMVSSPGGGAPCEPAVPKPTCAWKTAWQGKWSTPFTGAEQALPRVESQWARMKELSWEEKKQKHGDTF